MENAMELIKEILYVLLWGLFGVVAIAYMSFLWSSFLAICKELFLEIAAEQKKKKCLARSIGNWGGIVLLTVIGVFGGICVGIGYADQKFQYYIWAMLILMFLPAILYFILLEWQDIRRNKQYAEKVKRESQEMEERQEKVRREYRRRRGERENDSP